MLQKCTCGDTIDNLKCTNSNNTNNMNIYKHFPLASSPCLVYISQLKIVVNAYLSSSGWLQTCVLNYEASLMASSQLLAEF